MLEVKDIFVGYSRTIDILQGVSINVGEGSIVSIIGGNGVGKSTLLKAICGFLLPSKGKIIYKSEDITGIDPYRVPAMGIGYIPQRRSIFPTLTVKENLELGGWIFRRDKERAGEMVERICDKFPLLKEKRKTKAALLSGGVQRMVEIGRALMVNPCLLLVDEPTAGLAPKVAGAIYDVLKELTEEGRTVLLVDQNIHQAIEISSYIYVLELGKNKIEGHQEKFKTDLRELVRDWFSVTKANQ